MHKVSVAIVNFVYPYEQRINLNSVSVSLRLPNALRFNHWMVDSIEVLQHSPDAAPSDKKFIAWIKMQRIVEECGSALALDDPAESTVSLADERTQAVLRACESRLSDWRRTYADKEFMNRNTSTFGSELNH